MKLQGSGHHVLAGASGLIAERVVHRALGFAPRDVGWLHELSQAAAFFIVFFAVLYIPSLIVKSRTPGER